MAGLWFEGDVAPQFWSGHCCLLNIWKLVKELCSDDLFVDTGTGSDTNDAQYDCDYSDRGVEHLVRIDAVCWVSSPLVRRNVISSDRGYISHSREA